MLNPRQQLIANRLRSARWLKLAFCATGEGGGVDNSCGSGASSSGSPVIDEWLKLGDEKTKVVAAKKPLEAPEENTVGVSEVEVGEIETEEGMETQTLIIASVKAGGDLPQGLVDKLKDNPDGLSKFIYSAKSNTFHFASGGIEDVEHAQFVDSVQFAADATGMHELSQVRGILDLTTNDYVLYSLTDVIPDLASIGQKTPQSLAKIIDKNMEKCIKGLPKVGGNEPTFHEISINDIL